LFSLPLLLQFAFSVTAPKAEAQTIVDIGAEPECPYGYYDYEPYACAPYGYYSPEWFVGGCLPWARARGFTALRIFRGHVDSRFDVRRRLYRSNTETGAMNREASKAARADRRFQRR